jgi:hypothetical protein
VTEPARHLHLVDSHGEVHQENVCHGCIELAKKVAHLAGENTKLRKAEEERQASSIGSKQIREVLEFWRPLCMPRAKIVVGSERWQKVKARLADRTIEGELAYSVLHLKAAVVGAKLSPDHVQNGWLDASTIFRDSTTVDKHLARVTQFKRDTGVSALSITDELMSGRYERLAEVCDCGHIRLDHEKERPAEELWNPPCGMHGCSCPGWSTAPLWEQLRWAAERERTDAA